jgi:hypothetical protein
MSTSSGSLRGWMAMLVDLSAALTVVNGFFATTAGGARGSAARANYRINTLMKYADKGSTVGGIHFQWARNGRASVLRPLTRSFCARVRQTLL